MTPLPAKALAKLFSPAWDRSDFGPNSRNPVVVVDLAECSTEFSSLLATLPCPVIGVGAGPLNCACDVVVERPEQVAALLRGVELAPIAAMTLVQLLRISEPMPLEQALVAESLAYATLQNGIEFHAWLDRRVSSKPSSDEDDRLIVERRDTHLSLRLNRPADRNAIDVELRDALCNALELGAADDSIETISLTGNGRCFSIGGDLGEFGTVSDPSTAHWIRSVRLPARHALVVREKLSVRINGPAIGAGIEIAAFASRITASRSAWFQLPELRYGLIPGAGGTVSVARRIGRHRTVELILGMRRLTAVTALKWGLVDAVTA